MRVRLSNGLGREWRSPSAAPRLGPDQLLVWRAALEPQRTEILSPDEIERAASFKFELHRRRFIAARSILRMILAHLLDASPQAIELSPGPHGKPQLASESPIRFNVSHSADVALFAFALQREVGVDVEVRRTVEDAEQLAARFFSPGEAAQLRELSEPERSAEFLRLWTYKEACVKALGEGLAFPLDGIEIHANDARWTLFPIPQCELVAGAAVVAGDECEAAFLNFTPPSSGRRDT